MCIRVGGKWSNKCLNSFGYLYILLFISIKEERRVFPHCDLCIYSLFLWMMRSNVSNLFDVESEKRETSLNSAMA